MDISKSLLFLTQSSTPSPNPANHYGYLYASGSTLWWKNNQGQEFDLGLSSGSISISYYTGSVSGTQTYTWTRSPRLKYMTVICVGAGGGGGSGMMKGNLSQTGRGGLGGGGGAIVWTRFQKSDLPLTATITVGVGGIGGLSSTVSAGQGINTDVVGNIGATGENTSFSSLVIAGGGDGGAGGGGQLVTAIQGGRGGGNHNSIPPYGLYSLPGCYGGYGQTGTSPSGQNASVIGGTLLNALSPVINQSGVSVGIITGGGSGGGGGGCYSSTNLPTIGGSGSGVLTRSSITTGGSPGIIGTGNPGENGGNNIGNDLILQFGNIPTSPLITSLYGIGAGGGGGASSALNSNGGNGGNGGLYGAGGGGGGAAKRTLSTVTVSSGAGGNGSPGLCILIEYY